MGLFGRIASFLVLLVGKNSVRAFAFKVFLKVLIFTALPVIIMTAFNLIFGQIMNWVAVKIAEVETSSIPGVTFSGLSAYLYYELGIDIALSTLLSAFSIKFTLRSIPFLRY